MIFYVFHRKTKNHLVLSPLLVIKKNDLHHNQDTFLESVFFYKFSSFSKKPILRADPSIGKYRL